MTDLVKIADKTEFITRLGDLDGRGASDVKLSSLYNLNFSKWSDEAFLNLNYRDLTIKDEPTILKTGLVEVVKNDLKFNSWVLNDNVLEYSIAFSSIPSKFDLEFDLLDGGNLTYDYQRPLTEEEKKTCFRNERVDGSYAVYFNKKNNQYKTGKFAHIYRWSVIDANKQMAWCDMLVADGKLRISMPVDFMKKAKYPVRAMGHGDTVGFATQGGTDYSIVDLRNYVWWAGTESATVNGTADAAYVYAGAIGASDNGNLKVAIWEKGANVAATTLIDETDLYAIGENTAVSLRTLSGVSGSIVSGNDYIASVMVDITVGASRISGDAGAWGDIKIGTEADLNMPANLTGYADSNVAKMSAWYNYTEDAGGLSIPVSEKIAITESATTSMPHLGPISVVDKVAITEVTLNNLPLGNISVLEKIGIVENISINLPPLLSISVVEKIAITESGAAYYTASIQPSVAEKLGISESVTVTVGARSITIKGVELISGQPVIIKGYYT